MGHTEIIYLLSEKADRIDSRLLKLCQKWDSTLRQEEKHDKGTGSNSENQTNAKTK
jgi:hypothetical protein